MRAISLNALRTCVVCFYYEKSLGLHSIVESKNITYHFKSYLDHWDIDYTKSFFIYVGDNPTKIKEEIQSSLDIFHIPPEEMPKQNPGYTDFFKFSSLV